MVYQKPSGLNEKTTKARRKNRRAFLLKSILLRINPKLWQDLNAWAQDELHSLNGQIEYVLREAVRKRKKRNNSNSDT